MFSSLLGLLFGSAAIAGVAGGAGGSDDKSTSSDKAQSPHRGPEKPHRGTEPAPVETPEAQMPEPEPEPVEETPRAEMPEPEPEPVEETPQEEMPEPEPEPQPQPEPVETPGHSVDLSSGTPADVAAGRVTTLNPGSEANPITSLKVISGLKLGNVTVNPDNTFAVVLSGTSHTGVDSFRFEATYADGSSEIVDQSLNVVAPTAEGTPGEGWGDGHAYMLRTDAAGNLIVETGEIHRDVYVSASKDALTLTDIAAIEGLNVDQITASWLAQHPEYGSDPENALAQDAGKQLWDHLNAQSPNSNWLLLESGYKYEDMGSLLAPGVQGEDELHPIHITSYGDGPLPELSAKVSLNGAPRENIVFSNLHFSDGLLILNGKNIILENITSTNDEMSIQGFDERMENITLRNSSIYDATDDAPNGTDGNWEPHVDRESGLYMAKIDNLLIENSFFDHNGWEDGYDRDGLGSDGQPPSMFSHNIYLQYSINYTTFRDNITMQAGSYGAQIRGGGFLEDNVFLDNNAALAVHGGRDEGGIQGQSYSLLTDNVVTSAGYKKAEMIGAWSAGVYDKGYLTTFHENIIAHLADPNNPDEVSAKSSANSTLDTTNTPYYNDTIIYNWIGSREVAEGRDRDENTDDVNSALADQTTIQHYASALLGKPDATIQDLSDYLRLDLGSNAAGQTDADLIIAYFQKGFGIDVKLNDPGVQDFRFVPNDLGDGIRWDNRLNWDQGVLPGAEDGDNVDLAGNWVNYGGTTKVGDLAFGDGGKLIVTHGYLDVSGDLTSSTDGAELDIDASGQFWTNGFADGHKLDVDIDGGRFGNYGDFKGDLDMFVTDGQAVLASQGGTFDLSANSRLVIWNSDARVGFDGTDGQTAALRLEDDSTLGFSSHDGRLGTITEFRSGFFGDAETDVLSGVNLGEANLVVDLGGLLHSIGTHTLIDVDELIGNFGEVHISGLASDQDAQIVVDYETDTVALNIFGSGNGKFSYETLGDANDARQAAELWGALTEDQPVISDAPPLLEISEEDLLDAA